jgi:beta-lactamase regulating signal transducer with metallopeptidase domain
MSVILWITAMILIYLLFDEYLGIIKEKQKKELEFKEKELNLKMRELELKEKELKNMNYSEKENSKE